MINSPSGDFDREANSGDYALRDSSQTKVHAPTLQAGTASLGLLAWLGQRFWTSQRRPVNLTSAGTQVDPLRQVRHDQVEKTAARSAERHM
jgi:hypothetical protein